MSLPPPAIAALAALPWVLAPFIAVARAARSDSLDMESDVAPTPAPIVSIVIPARNERRNIERCLRSVLASTYPALDVIVVDDHSDDGTGELARQIAANDSRCTVIENAPLPPDWFGKQWACATGAKHARGSLLLFIDADTQHSPDLVTRAVNAMTRMHAALLSVAGRQEMHSFWERLVQPQVFALLLTRYGGTGSVNRARRPQDVIANGQFIMVTRDAYSAVGGHASVRDTVAEDLALAQLFFAHGDRVRLVTGIHQLSTHMYAGLRELIRGWGKNVFAGGRHAMPGGRVGRFLFPLALLLGPVFTLLPALVLALALAGWLPFTWLVWSGVAAGATALWWTVIYHYLEEH